MLNIWTSLCGPHFQDELITTNLLRKEQQINSGNSTLLIDRLAQHATQVKTIITVTQLDAYSSLPSKASQLL